MTTEKSIRSPSVVTAIAIGLGCIVLMLGRTSFFSRELVARASTLLVVVALACTAGFVWGRRHPRMTGGVGRVDGGPPPAPDRATEAPSSDGLTRWVSPPMPLAMFGIGLMLMVVGQASFARRDDSSVGLGVWLFGLGLLVLGGEVGGRSDIAGRTVVGPVPTPRTSWTSWRTVLPGVGSLLSAIVLWRGQRSRPLDDPHGDLVVIWLVSMMFGVLALWQPSRSTRRATAAAVRSWWVRNRTEALAAAGLGVAAAVPLFVMLGSYPRTFNGDEANLAVISRQVLQGRIPNPFGVGFLSHPLIGNVVQAGSMGILGDGVAGARASTAFAGALAVSSSYLLIRRLTARNSTAIAAAALLGTSYLHLYWSRSALPNGWTAAWMFLVLFLLDRALATSRPVGLLLTGLALGASQYFYFASRALIPVVLGILLVTALVEHRRIRRLGAVIRLGVVRATVVATGFLLAVVPQLAYYSVRPFDFDSRVQSVSIFSSGWLRQESQRTGLDPIVIVLRQFVEAAMVPFRTTIEGHVRGGPPYVGWPLALLGAIGLAVVTARIGRGGLWTALALSYWIPAAGVATTVEPGSARSLIAVTLVPLLAAIGLDFVVRALGQIDRVPSRVWYASAAAIVIATGSWNMFRFFRSPDQTEVYGDTNTEVVDHLARSLPAIDPEATVYFAGAPRIWFHGFRNFEFRAPSVTGIDVEQPLTPLADRPKITGTTLFVFLPERIDELDVVEDWFPIGVTTEVTDRSGRELYTSYRVDP